MLMSPIILKIIQSYYFSQIPQQYIIRSFRQQHSCFLSISGQYILLALKWVKIANLDHFRLKSPMGILGNSTILQYLFSGIKYEIQKWDVVPYSTRFIYFYYPRPQNKVQKTPKGPPIPPVSIKCTPINILKYRIFYT